MAKKNLLKLSDWGEDYEIALIAAEYAGGNLAIAMEYYDSEEHQLMPYATLTVNLVNEVCEENCAFVDVNNLGSVILEWLSINKLGTPTGRCGRSGFCVYPEIKFDMNEVKKHAK